MLPRRDLSSRCGRTAVPRSSALVPAAQAHLPSPSSVSLCIDAGRGVSSNISEGIGPEVKPAPLFRQELCVLPTAAADGAVKAGAAPAV